MNPVPPKYVTVKVPIQLAEAIDEVIEQGKKGYKSRAEFVKEAVRLRLEEVKQVKS